MGVYDRNKNHPERGANWWIDYYVGADRHREPGCGRNKTASDRLLAKRLREIERGTWRKPEFRGEGLTCSQYAERWSAIREAEGIKTQSDYDARLRDHVLPTIGEMPITKVERPDIKALIASIMANGKLAPRSINHVYDAARAMFARALEDGLIAATPCTLKQKRGELPPKKDKNPRWRHTALYHPLEVVALISEEDVVPWNRRVFYALMFLTGTRFGEAAGRQWCDWDRAARPLTRITVATQYDNQELKSPTGEAPVRHVPVHPVLSQVLTEWWDRGFALTYGRDPKPSDWIVPSLQDGVSLRTLRNGLKRLREDCKRLGLRDDRTQHDARRTLYTSLRSLGADDRLVSVITHGASVSDTASHYEVWQWPVLSDLILRLPIALPNRSHIGHTRGLGAAIPPVSRGNLGGADGTRSSGPLGNVEKSAIDTETVHASPTAETVQNADASTQVVTPRVSMLHALSQAQKLTAAADALRSGRVEGLTAEWRGELADACDEASEMVRARRAESEVG